MLEVFADTLHFAIKATSDWLKAHATSRPKQPSSAMFADYPE
jgi:hypothetical protein